MKTKSIISLVILIIVILFTVFAIYFRQKPPVEIISEARHNILKAEKIHASEYTGELFKKAGMYYDSAMNQWSKENKKFFFNRNFELVEKYANQSNLYALKAIDKSNENVTKTEKELESRIIKLKEQISSFIEKFGKFPFNEINTKELARCKLLLNEGTISFEQSQYSVAKNKIDSAEYIIQQLEDDYRNILEEYFEDYSKWNHLVETSVLMSKKHKTFCIVIDKYGRECFLYKNGILKEKFTIELGTNWIGDKNHQGDKSTPEGSYQIISKKATGETKFYKALLLNYPNEEDKKRFLFNKKNGVINKDAKIGNLIEIHGDGGKGIDWTDGCIALKNTDMDKLFEVCSIGTSVTIVGSTKSLNDI